MKSSDQKNIAQHYSDALKLQDKTARIPKKNENDDEDSSGSGGNGKRMQGSYKLEKLVNVLAKGRMKAQNFWRFLSKEGLDTHETKKTTLGKQKEHAVKVTEKLEKTQEIKQNQERAQELQKEQFSKLTDEEQQQFVSDEEREYAENKADLVWEKAKASDINPHQRFTSQEGSSSSYDTGNIAESTRRSIMGDHIPGAITSGTTNPLGFIKQVDVTGEASKANAVVTNQHIKDKLGNRIAGTTHSKDFDHSGTPQFNHDGKTAEGFLYVKGTASFLGQNKNITASSAVGSNNTQTAETSKSMGSRTRR